MKKQSINTDLLDLSIEEMSEVMLENEVYTGQKSQLIVYNDDFNTFDWVIQCFIEVCNHTFEQAEQLSILVHFKGKTIVKTGPLDELKPMKDSLIEKGLSAVIETLVED